MSTPESRRPNLFQHDQRILANIARASVATWHDRLIVGVMLSLALAAVHYWFAERAWPTALWAALGCSVFIGISAGRLVIARLKFHRFDGLLAADSLKPLTRRAYVCMWHGIGAVLLAAIALVALPKLVPISIAGYLTGVLVAELTGGLGLPGILGGVARRRWAIRARLHRPLSGVALAIALLLSLLPVRTSGTNPLIATVGIATFLVGLILSGVDASIVRFLAIAGHGSRRIVAHHGKGIISFVAMLLPGSWLIFGTEAAGAVIVTSLVTFFLLTLRILSYRLHAKRFADLLVSLVIALILFVGYLMPIALPVIAIAVLWQLERRGRAKTWLVT